MFSALMPFFPVVLWTAFRQPNPFQNFQPAYAEHTLIPPDPTLLINTLLSVSSPHILCGVLSSLSSWLSTLIDPDHTRSSADPGSLTPPEVTPFWFRRTHYVLCCISVCPVFGALRVSTEPFKNQCFSSTDRPSLPSRVSCHCWSTTPKVYALSNVTLPTIPMFAAPRASSSRQRSASRSTDDRSSTKDTPRRLPQRYAQDLSISSQSLATTSSHHDDLPTPPVPTHTSHTTSAHSTPMTSPSTRHSSPFPGSLSSATSESVPSVESKYRSEFGLLTSGSSSAYSPILGSASSRSSHPVSPPSRSTTESDPQALAPRMLRKHPSGYFSHRPSTAPHSPSVLATASGADNGPADHHTRSHSRLTVSIKNLLSKPAITSPSRFSFNSAKTMPLDGEASSRSFHLPAAGGKWSMTPRKSRPPDLEISGSVASATPSPGRTSTPIDAHRRYASEVAAKSYNAGTGNGPPTSQENLDVLVQNVPPSPARGREPKTRNVLRRRPSGSAKLFKRRERGISSPSRPHEGDADHLRLPPKECMPRQGGLPFPLTAAGAVVEAYKQQDLHRDDSPSPPKLSIDDRMSSSASHDGGCDRDRLEHSPAPYYTVFGSSSRRRMQAGGPDDLWSRSEADQCILTMSQATSSHQPSVSDSGGRGLTRKVSNRWRKVKGGGAMSEESPSRDREHSKGRPSLQEMWGGDKSNTRSTGRSMDGVSNVGDGPWASPIAGHARSGDGSEGGKLWRLMRRISTGGLRDRFQPDKVVPPVPAIPKELLEKVNHDERSNEPLSMSRHQPSSSSCDKGHTRTSMVPKNIAVTRPSVATSSSPNSSNVASPQFFHKIHSTRSSVSSYGEAVVVPCIPEIVLDRHIITPLEQLRLGDDHVESGEPGTSSVPVPRSPRRSTSVPTGLRTPGDAEGDHVPFPSPRHQTCSGESPPSSRPSSTSASASGSPHASYQSHGPGLGWSRMVDGTVSLSPPPRPPKSSRRGGGGSVASSHSHSTVVKQVNGGIGIGDVRQMDRTPSAQSDMTARLESPEPGRSRGQGRDRDRAASPHTSTQPTFRELAAPRRPPLSEREKADIWDDLLARSDQAGGTLHINGAAELMSDSMRFSTHSEI